jgi:hypothetical protein
MNANDGDNTRAPWVVRSLLIIAVLALVTGLPLMYLDKKSSSHASLNSDQMAEIEKDIDVLRYQEKTNKEVLKTLEGMKAQAEGRRFNPDTVQLFTRIGVTTLALLGSLFVVISRKSKPVDKHAAYGIIGTLIGYWLHS